MKISLIVAMTENRVIGKDGDIPWKLPEDQKRFKSLTQGHTLIMGRRTYESIGRPLPNRRNVVVTRQKDYSAPGCEVVESLDAALRLARTSGETEAFVGGGAGLYAEALPAADRIYLTVIHTQAEGDTFFPEFDTANFVEASRERMNGPLEFSYVTYDKKNPGR